MATPIETLDAARAGNTEPDDLENMAAEALSPYPPGSARHIGEEPTNDDRARWAERAAEVFAAITGQAHESDRYEIAADLISDLLHWCDREPTDTSDEPSDSVAERGVRAYLAERGEARSVYLEDIGPRFAELIERASGELSAPVFATDLAAGGATSEHVETMAHRWKNGDFEPSDFADELLAFGHELRDVEREAAEHGARLG